MKHLRQKALASAIAALPLVNHAAPQDGVVVAGSAVIRQETPTKIGITQTTDRAIIDWRSYSIGVNEHVQYYQPSAASATLNRVTGQDPSQILGRLTANGQVFLVNPNGIYFGRNAQIDVAGLVASTHNIRNADFMAGNYTFDIPGKPGASVINEGAVRIADTGIAAFVAPSVANRGIVAARLGKVAMAAANGFTLDFTGDNLLSFMVNDEVAQTAFDLEGNRLTSFVENSGKIEAQGGFVLLTAKAAENAIHGVINHSGVIEATSVGKQNGEIILAGGQHGAVAITGSLDASGKGAGETGGKVQVTGNAIALDSGTRIDVSGNLGGGKVIVGGDYLGGSASNEQLAAHGMTREPGDIQTATSVTVSEGAIIDASALLAGNGGKVVVWANDTLHYDGKIYARGGMLSGHGGVVETSGKENLYVRGTVDAGAANGRGGLWFLDPIDVVVANSGGTVLPSVIASALNTGTVYTVRATSDRRPGSITVLDDIRKTAGGTATLELITNGAVILNRGGRIVSTSGKLNVKIDARKEVADPGYNLVAIGNDTAYAIETNGGQVDITGLIQTYQGKAIKTNGGQVLARTTPTENDSDTRGFIGIGPVPLNDTSAYTIDAGNGKVNMRATGGTITLDDHAIKGNTVLLRGDVYARPNILSFNMADEASRQRIERNFGGASGYGTNFPSNDDDSIPVSITSLAGTGLTLLGRDFGETIYLSNNGYIRLDTRDGTYTPYPLNSTNNPIIAAYFGDVDTRGAGNVYYATRATANDNKVALTWIGTGYFSRGTDKTNTFQLQVENLGVETNMRFSYQQLQWTTGSASGGSNGLGGTVARAGFAIPGRNETIRFELPSSGRETDMLALASLPGNTGKVGVWSFRLWPEATPPNRNNGRFEVAANTLTVNGNSSGHQLERGAPGSSNVENVDRRRTEDYLNRLLVKNKYRFDTNEPVQRIDAESIQAILSAVSNTQHILNAITISPSLDKLISTIKKYQKVLDASKGWSKFLEKDVYTILLDQLIELEKFEPEIAWKIFNFVANKDKSGLNSYLKTVVIDKAQLEKKLEKIVNFANNLGKFYAALDVTTQAAELTAKIVAGTASFEDYAKAATISGVAIGSVVVGGTAGAAGALLFSAIPIGKTIAEFYTGEGFSESQARYLEIIHLKQQELTQFDRNTINRVANNGPEDLAQEIKQRTQLGRSIILNQMDVIDHSLADLNSIGSRFAHAFNFSQAEREGMIEKLQELRSSLESRFTEYEYIVTKQVLLGDSINKNKIKMQIKEAVNQMP